MRGAYFCVLDTCSHPYVRLPRELIAHSQHSFWPLSENLITMPVSTTHDIEYTLNELIWHIFMEQVAH